MLKHGPTEPRDLPNKRPSQLSVVFLIISAITVLFLAGATVAPNAASRAEPFSVIDRGHEETARQKILDWMSKNSSMPAHLLEEIYDAAALVGNISGNRDLLLAICLVESNFNPEAESDKGAIGLMGIMPGVWVNELKDQGIISEKGDLYRISENIAAGAHVLRKYLGETNDLRQALVRYVGGASWYANKVFQAHGQLRQAQYADLHLVSAGSLD